MNTSRLSDAQEAVARLPRSSGIGTLGERTLHAVLKFYMEPDPSYHEKRVGSFVADIARPEGIVEIQTRGLNRLRRKLDTFLEHSPVTVVYPIASIKYLIWVDPATDEAAPRRKSPRRGTPLDAFAELYKIKPYLRHPNLSVCLLLMEIEEYRLKNGWSQDGKKVRHAASAYPRPWKANFGCAAPAITRLCFPQSCPSPFPRHSCARSPRKADRCAKPPCMCFTTLAR